MCRNGNERNFSKIAKEEKKKLKKADSVCLFWDRGGSSINVKNICLLAETVGEAKLQFNRNPKITEIFINGSKSSAISSFVHWCKIKKDFKGKIFWVDAKSRCHEVLLK
ncbi:MAG: hypothetical protein V1851_01010 [Patescibacteria group bacterium]